MFKLALISSAGVSEGGQSDLPLEKGVVQVLPTKQWAMWERIAEHGWNLTLSLKKSGGSIECKSLSHIVFHSVLLDPKGLEPGTR